MAEPFLGEIRMFGFNFNPRGWAHCDGQLLPISQNSALFSLLGTIYGGDGRTTFALPNLQSRVPIHKGQGAGLSNYVQGSRGGAENHTLGVNQIPAHSHTVRCNSAVGALHTNNPANAVWATDAGAAGATYSTDAPNANMSANALNNTGGGQPVDHRQPYLTINFCIALVGLFPSRN